jgi:hypothetical protein
MKAPTNPILNAFWDAKSRSYSIPRVILLGGFILFAWTMIVVLQIVHDAFYSYREVPDLSWLAAFFGGSVVGSTMPYIISRISAKNDPSEITAEIEKLPKRTPDPNPEGEPEG